MANSSLATYRNMTKNNSGKRTQKIKKITPHCMAAPWSGKQCADYFASTTRQASSNYCVGISGDIAVSVDEDCRAWTSSSEWNDQRAVTIECGNNADLSFPDACYKSLVALCADICKRHGINPHYDGTANGTITFHQMFAQTSCPGNWMINKITSGQFEKDIKAKMSGSKKPKPAPFVPIKDAGKGALYRLYAGGDHLYTQSLAEANSLKKAGWSYEGVAWTAPDAGNPVYRLYNSSNGKHHYTLSAGEKAALIKAGWKDEGVAFKSGGKGRPIYRMYNPANGGHLLTALSYEHDNLVKVGWKCEGQEIKH